MVKSKFALFTDSVFISVLLFFIMQIWVKKLTKNAFLVNFLSIFISLSLFIIIYFLLLKSHGKKILIQDNNKYLIKCLNMLIIFDNNSYIKFITNLFSCKHISGFMFQIDNNFLYINIKTELTDSDYFLAYEIYFKHKNNDSKLFFILNKKSKSFDDIISLSNLNITILSAETITKLMTMKNIYPISKESKPSFKIKFSNSFKHKTSNITKSNFKNIFFSGISLLTFSFIVPFSKYYLIAGTILILISVISIFRKNYTPKNSNTDFIFKTK